MIIIAPEAEDRDVGADVNHAHGELIEIIEDLKILKQRVRAGEVEIASDAKATLQMLRGLVKLAVETEKTLAEERKRNAGIAAGDTAFDLDAARVAIGCKMARLRRCCREE